MMSKEPRPDGAPAAAAAGETSPPQWQRLRYPSDAVLQDLLERYNEEVYSAETGDLKPYYQLPPFVRLGWPTKAAWEAVKHLACGKVPYAELQAQYPDRDNVEPRQQDFPRLLRHYPDCFGQAFVTVHIQMVDGITINDLTYGPGPHRVPEGVAWQLGYIDQRARQAFIDQFIPKIYQDRVLATLNGKTGQAE
jgi:hypothetical protein